MKLMNIAIIIVAIIAINYIVSAVMTFLGVSVTSYISYLLWIFALMLFWGILPPEEKYFT